MFANALVHGFPVYSLAWHPMLHTLLVCFWIDSSIQPDTMDGPLYILRGHRLQLSNKAFIVEAYIGGVPSIPYPLK